MKTFWKVLGAAALAVGLTPYKVEKNEETGESSYQALLYRLTSAPGQGENKWDIGINLGEGTLTSKLLNGAEKAEEPHLFSDELCVEYNGASAAEEAPAAEEAEAEEAAPVEPVPPVEPVSPVEPVPPVEEVPAEEKEEE